MAQHVAARLDLDRKQPTPKFIEYVSADKGLVTFGQMSRKTSRYLGLTKYDKDFTKSWSKKVIQQNGRNHVDLISVLGDNIYVFISEFFPRDKSIRTFYYHYDLKGNRVVDKKQLSEKPNVREHKVDLKYTRSLNKKKLLCFKNLNNANKKEKIL